MPLPRQDFWAKVGQLLDTVEMEIHDVYRNVGPSLKMQTIQKRQANIRRTASELARKRLVAMMQHSASAALRTSGGADGQELANLDWSRHDPTEREFYSNATEQLNRFKQSVNWNAMQMGLASEELSQNFTMAAGTTQLDSFVPESGGLTGQGPPAIALEENSKPLPDMESDEEDDLAKADAFPELEGIQPVEERPVATAMEEGSNHAAAMELAPSKKNETMDFDAWAAAEAAVETPPTEIVEEALETDQQLMRIRVLQSMDDPIITADGEIELGAGDILFLDETTANYLVDSGVAESAAL